MDNKQGITGQSITIIAVSTGLSFLALMAVTLRFLVRRNKGGKYYIDDHLIVLGLILALGVSINNIIGASLAGIGQREDLQTFGPAKGFPLSKPLKRQGKVMYAMQILHTCAMLAIKASVLTFYSRVFPTKNFRWVIYGASAFVSGWWLTTLLVSIFQCHPIALNWGTDPSMLGKCLARINDFYEAAAFFCVIGSIIIVALPLPVVIGLPMTPSDMMAIAGTFLIGVLVIGAGLGRTVSYLKDHYNHSDDFSYWYYPIVLWTSIEPNLGVISACLPTLRPLCPYLVPEAIIGFIIDLYMYLLRRNNPVKVDRGREDCQRLSSSLAPLRSPSFHGRSCELSTLSRLPDPNGSTLENEVVAQALKERKELRKDLPRNVIKVQRKLVQTSEYTETHGMEMEMV